MRKRSFRELPYHQAGNMRKMDIGPGDNAVVSRRDKTPWIVVFRVSFHQHGLKTHRFRLLQAVLDQVLGDVLALVGRPYGHRAQEQQLVFIPALDMYIADYALSLLAADLGHTEDAEKFRAQSLQYKHYYCPEFGTLRPLQKDGTFLAPFNPRQGENFEPVPGFHEGSAWNYTFYVPHDVIGLSKLMGGRKAFVNKLQRVFDEGLYDPANEPDIAYPYLFSYFKGEEWRTAKIVSDLLDKHYTTRPDGIPGNDDTGTMSAWAVFSMMGFYPDCPGDPSYTLTTPRFDRVEITLDPRFCDGRDRLVITKGRHMKGRVTHNDLIHNNL